MTVKTTTAGARPADLDRQAAWPPRVAFHADPVTVTDSAVVRKPTVPEGGYGVRVGSMPMSGDVARTDGASAMPTDGPGVARRAMPAPESAETTGTIPPVAGLAPSATTVDVSPAPRAMKRDKGRR